MIKNKTLHIKIIFKNIKNMLGFQTYFYFIKYHKIILKNYFLELFLEIVIKAVISYFLNVTKYLIYF